MPFDEEELDPHGECRAEIERLLGACKDKSDLLTAAYAQVRSRDTEIERLRAALGQLRRSHLVLEEDCWYSCPKSGECCDDNAGNECNCGADAHNAIIDAALAPHEQSRQPDQPQTGETK